MTAISRLILVAAPLALTACGALPDVGPFADATVETRSALIESFRLVEANAAEMAELTDRHAPEAHQRFENSLSQIREARLARAAALDALVEYADSLDGIVDASRSASENARALADAVGGLVSAFSATPLPGVAVGVLNRATEQAIKIAALGSLERGLTQADPIVGDLAGLLLNDLENLAAAAETSLPATIDALELPENDRLSYRRLLIETRDQQVRTLLDSGGGADASSVGAIAETESAIAATASWHEPLERRRETARRRDASSRALVAQARTLVTKWRDAHAQLVVAVRQGREPNVRALVAAAIELRALVERGREAP